MKNLMLFFPPFLGGTLLQVGVLERIAVPFFSFCLASSSTYIFNDILDADSDANHKKKKNRPIPAGAVSRTSAAMLGLGLAVSGVFLGIKVSNNFLILLFCYLFVSFLYSFKLKQYPIVDIFCISAGFIFRLQAGGDVFNVAVSEWLFLSVFLLALFLSTGKRVCEKRVLGENAGSHRKSLMVYSDGFLEGTMYMTGSAVLVTYTMYVISRHALIYTVPLCTFGLFRYIFLVKSGKYGDPTESLIRDRVLFGVGFVWAVMVGWGIYGR